ncbi:MAG: nitrogen fixation protein NifX [Methylococcales bacterium]|nr:MAG: nitrogen fixation protein NifX [Methylococcales bacterium]
MSGQDTITRELALRIGLAARAWPDIDAKGLFILLTDYLGLPLTEQKIAGITLKDLKTLQTDGVSRLEEDLLLQLLNTLQTPVDTSEPIQAYQEGDLPGSIRLAFASNDRLNVDGHFGSCKQFMIYQVSACVAQLIDVRTPKEIANLEIEDKNTYRAELINDCQVVYMVSVGGPAAAKIVKQGIHPLKLSDIESISDVILQLQAVIAGTPPPWLAKVMGIEASQRFKFEREEAIG